MLHHSPALRVSVIIPCYMDAATLRSALDSAFAQTRPVDEVVVVNDCSPQTPEIEDIVAAYPAVVYVRNAKNLGLAASRNVGLRATTCEVATFLDADDELHPQKIEYQLREYQGSNAVACRVERFQGHGGVRPSRYPANYAVRSVSSSKSIIFQNRLTGASLMASRALLLRCGGYDESLRSCEDFDLWLRLLDHGVIVRDIQLPLYRYRVNPHGLSRNNFAISHWELEALERYFSRHEAMLSAKVSRGPVVAFWLVKHIWRYETGHDDRLRSATRTNIRALPGSPLLKVGLSILDRGRLLWPLALVRQFLQAVAERKAPEKQ